MWPFNRKAKNRRFEHHNVLDVKLSAAQARATRVRFASMAMGLTFGTLFVVFLMWRGGAWMLDRWVYENESFAIHSISVETDGVLSQDQLRRWAGVQVGMNLFGLDLPRVKRDLELVPMIQSVAVERVLPQTLRIRITERQPIAQILQPLGPGVRDQALYTLDEKGFVMLPVRPQQRAIPWAATNEFLPILTGVNHAELRPGRPVESLPVKAALRLLTEFERSPMAGLVDVRWIDLASPEVMTLTTGQGCRVVFGSDRLEVQLRRWRVAHDYARQRGKSLANLDLSVANNVPFTVVDASAVVPVPAKSVKPVRPTPKRKNV
ncbi:MAG: FtsQ-type POTRA domain-containing protein [Verrucomicrobiota bacterium]